MGTPDINVKKFRWLVVLALLGALVACSKSNDDCDVSAVNDACNTVGEDGSQSDSNDSDSQNVSTPAPLCASEQSDFDGDGYGFENGASCRVSGAFVTVADINHVIVVPGSQTLKRR